MSSLTNNENKKLNKLYHELKTLDKRIAEFDKQGYSDEIINEEVEKYNKVSEQIGKILAKTNDINGIHEDFMYEDQDNSSIKKTKSLLSLTPQQYTKAVRDLSRLFENFIDKSYGEKGESYFLLNDWLPSIYYEDTKSQIEQKKKIYEKLIFFLDDSYKMFKQFPDYVDLPVMKTEIDKIKQYHFEPFMKAFKINDVKEMAENKVIFRDVFKIFTASSLKLIQKHDAKGDYIFKINAPPYEDRIKMEKFYVFYYDFYNKLKKEIKMFKKEVNKI